MFTGLIQRVGRLDHISFQGDAGRLALTAGFDSPLQIGESIAVNGACLTLVEQQDQRLVFDVLRETFEKTALREKVEGDPLNLERALRMGDPLGGHLVSGHVDGTGVVVRIEEIGRDKGLVVSAPALIPDIVPKGSIAIDGISLTVVAVSPDPGTFSVHVIPHTWHETAFPALTTGSRVNLETDLLGKYVRAALEGRGHPPAVTWNALQKAGFSGGPD